MNWSELPDLAAVALLSCAFASVTRRNRTPVSGLWLTGWIMIVLHFGASMLYTLPGFWGSLFSTASLLSLVWAGILFMWASVPYREQISSRWMLAAMVATNTIYLLAISYVPTGSPLLAPAAALFAAFPLGIAIFALRKFVPVLVSIINSTGPSVF